MSTEEIEETVQDEKGTQGQASKDLKSVVKK